MKPMLLFTLLYIVIAGCTGNHAQLAKLQSIDSLMEQNPQAAYDSLCLYKKQMMEDSPRKVEMRYRLLTAKAQNKLYLEMPSDSVFREVVDYYESKGTSNEKMEAYYLMGSVYRDQKEAPKAMMSYMKAVECADTLSKDCDYTTLFRIYGQMADIYRCQYLHKEAIACEQKYSYYAAKAYNTISFIQGFDLIASEYYELGDTLKAMQLTEKSYRLYKQHGKSQDAARVLPTLIYVYLQRAQYQQAHFYMDIFEKESGLFDKNRNLLSGREHYYKAKGMYYLGVNLIDSAEYYYRKLGHYGFKYETAQGLLSVYRMRLNPDSIKKYSILCEQEMDMILNTTQANAVVQASSLYDYTRLQKQLDEEKLHEVKIKYIVVFVAFVVFLGLGLIIRRFYKMKLKLAEKLAEAERGYGMTLLKMEKVRKELELLQMNKNAFIEKKQEEIRALQISLQVYKEKCDKLLSIGKKQVLMKSDIVEKFEEMSIFSKKNEVPQEADWKDLRAIFEKCQPVLFEKILSGQLSPQEFQVCILTYLGMDNTAISVLVNTTTKTVSNAKQKANSKLFNDKSAATLYRNLLNV